MTMSGAGAPILEIDGLGIDYRVGDRIVRALDGVSLKVCPGDRLGIVGDSGSGKSTLALAIMGYVAPSAVGTRGAVRFCGQDLLTLDSGSLRRLRASELAMVQQEPMATLNPGLTLGAQLRETPRLKTVSDLEQRVVAALKRVRLAEPARIIRSYPHQLSGGQLQRVAIAMALLGEPRLLLLDEPTTALDTATEAEIVALLDAVCASRELTVIHVSHDRDLLAASCERIVEMRDGRIVGEGATADASPVAQRTKVIPPEVPSARKGEEGVALAVKGLSKIYTEADRWNRATGRVVALTGVDFRLRRGETLAIVGESGSGKSTLGRIVAGLETATAGNAILDGTDIARVPVTRRPASLLRAVQMIFQDPDGSLNPRLTVGHQIGRALRAGGCVGPDRDRQVAALLESVRLPADLADRRPRALSGGQKQRVAIACAFAVRPWLIVADEPVSALDATAQAAALDLLAALQREHGTALLLISHDLAVVRSVADHIAVLYRGRVMEQGNADAVLRPPYHPYTEMLLMASRRTTSAATAPASQHEAGLTDLTGTGQGNAGHGCFFAAHCPYRIAGTCETIPPPLRAPAADHAIHCHLGLPALPRPGI